MTSNMDKSRQHFVRRGSRTLGEAHELWTGRNSSKTYPSLWDKENEQEREEEEQQQTTERKQGEGNKKIKRNFDCWENKNEIDEKPKTRIYNGLAAH